MDFRTTTSHGWYSYEVDLRAPFSASLLYHLFFSGFKISAGFIAESFRKNGYRCLRFKSYIVSEDLENHLIISRLEFA